MDDTKNSLVLDMTSWPDQIWEPSPKNSAYFFSTATKHTAANNLKLLRDGQAPRKLCLWCFSCSVAMKDLQKHEAWQKHQESVPRKQQMKQDFKIHKVVSVIQAKRPFHSRFNHM